MKRLILPFVCWVLYALFAASQCKKDKSKSDNPYGLPKATQTGAMTFACLINGEPYIAKSSTIGTGGGASKDSIFVFGRNGPGVYFWQIFFIIKKEWVTNITIDLNDESNYFDIAGDHDCRGILIDAYRFRGIGSVLFTRIDTINKIMSGVFNCEIPVLGCDTLKMTEGRFDIRYYN